VKRAEGPDLIVDMGRTEARLPKREQSKLENLQYRRAFARGDQGRGPGCQRAASESCRVRMLHWCSASLRWKCRRFTTAPCRFARRRAKRRAHEGGGGKPRQGRGSRGRLRWHEGMRVQSIIPGTARRENRHHSLQRRDSAFAQKALSPAKVTRVQITDPENRKLEVIVEDSQLSLAIGKKGQNVRLASKLIGWDIDIKSEEEKRREIEEQMTALTAPTTPLTGCGGRWAQDDREDRSRWDCEPGKTGQHDAGTADGNSGHRRKKWWTRFIRP